jgi:hypothetical protein
MRGLAKETIELIMFARLLLEQLHPMTLRQLHYAVFSAAKIAYENTHNEYRRLGRATTRARRDYRALELAGETDLLDSSVLIPGAWIIDELRESEIVSMWNNLDGYLDAVRSSYRRNNWQDQPHHVEVFSEKGAVLGSLRPVTQEYGVRLRPCRGFGSCGMETEIGDLFEGIDKPITMLYVGDHDASGDDIPRDIRKRAEAASGKAVHMVRLAIHPEDIVRFNLPPQKIKPKDPRAAAFMRKYGDNAPTIELDALPVDELRNRVRSAIEGLIDWDLWNHQIDVQEVELRCIRDFADRVKNLPQMPQP